MEITITITQLEGLIQAINNLAGGISGGKATILPGAQNTQQPSVPTQNGIPISNAPTQGGFTPPQVGQPSVAPSNPTMQTAPGAATQNIPQIMQQPVSSTQVITSQTAYTLDDLSRAAITLMDSGKQQDLINLLGQFGVTSLPEVPKEQYGAFATALRGLGAQI